MDFRILSTLSSIDSALIEILEEKPLAEVTVKELCARAEINRATFYRHYMNIPDLMAKTESNLLESLEEQLRLNSSNPLDIEGVMLFVSKTIKTDGKRYSVLFSENGDPNFLNKVFEVAYKHSRGDVQDIYPNLTETQRQWLFSYVANGCSAIWQRWIADKMSQSPEEIAEFATKLILKGADGFHPCNHVKDGFVYRASGVSKLP